MLNVGADVLAPIEGDHARFVDHFVVNRHVPGALMDLVGVAVNGRHHGSGKAARDASIVEAAILVGVGRSAATPCRSPSGSSLPGFVGLRRNLAVGRMETSHARLFFGK